MNLNLRRGDQFKFSPSSKKKILRADGPPGSPLCEPLPRRLAAHSEPTFGRLAKKRAVRAVRAVDSGSVSPGLRGESTTHRAVPFYKRLKRPENTFPHPTHRDRGPSNLASL